MPDLTEAIVRGGWPALQSLPTDAAAAAVADYLEEISRIDINQVDGVRRDPVRVRRLIASLGRNVATYASMATLAADSGAGGEDPLKDDTAAASPAEPQTPLCRPGRDRRGRLRLRP